MARREAVVSGADHDGALLLTHLHHTLTFITYHPSALISVHVVFTLYLAHD